MFLAHSEILSHHVVPNFLSINRYRPFPDSFLLKKTDTGSTPFLDLDDDQQQQEDKEIPILCKTCGHIITYERYRYDFQGQSSHTFLNPTGIIFEITCFKEAEGCLAVGPFSSEWSWFPDYKWQVSICGNCNSHLGWFYSNRESNSFFGLILNTLN